MPVKMVVCNICGREVTKRQSKEYKDGRCCREHQDFLNAAKEYRIEALKTCVLSHFSSHVYDRMPGGIFYESEGMRSIHSECESEFNWHTCGSLGHTKLGAVVRKLYLLDHTHEEGAVLFEKELVSFCEKYRQKIALLPQDKSLNRGFEDPFMVRCLFHFACGVLDSSEEDIFIKGQRILEFIKRYEDQLITAQH